MEKGKLGGVVFPLVTPFCGEDEHVNYPALDKLIDFLIENGAARLGLTNITARQQSAKISGKSFRMQSCRS